MDLKSELESAAQDEIDRACTLNWRQLAKLIPWGDTFEGFTRLGRNVCFERSYLWDGEPGGDIAVEVIVYEAHAYEKGVKFIRSIRRKADQARKQR